MGQAQNQLFDGMEILDWDGVKIGKITRYDKKLGYMQTEFRETVLCFKRIVVILGDHGDGFGDLTYMYLDDVAVNVQ